MYQGAVQLDALRDGSFSDWYAAWTDLDPTRPSLVSTLTVLPFALFGANNDAGLLVNVAALVLLLLATGGLGTAVGGRRSGLMAILLVGSYPVLVGLVHILLAELLMVALVAATLLALWRSDGFRHRRWSIVAGVLIGLGLVTKVFFVAFVVGPWLIAALQVIPRAQNQWKLRQAGNLLASLLIAAIIASSWYLPNLKPVLDRTLDAGMGAEGAPYGPAQPLRWASLRDYFLRFVGTGASFAGFSAFLLGCVGLGITALRSRHDVRAQPSSDRYAIIFLASSVAVGYLLFTSLKNQDLKHVTGILPALAVLSGWGIARLCGRWWSIVAGVLLVGSLLQAVVGTVPGWWQNYQYSVPVSGSELFLFYPAQPAPLNTRYALPDPTRWPLHELLSYALYVADLEGLPRDRAHVGVIPNHPGLEEHALRFEAYRQRMPVVIATALVSNLMNQDVLIHKTGDWGWEPSRPAIDEVMEALAQPDTDFQRLPRTFALPDGSEAIVYARRPSPLLPRSPSPAHPILVEFGHSARFLGFDVTWVDATAGVPTLAITFYWESLAATQEDYSLFVHLLDSETGEIVAQDDHPLFPRVYPTSMWQANRFLFEQRMVKVPPSFSGSALTLRLGLYNKDGRLPLTFPPAESAAGTTFADVGSISLDR